MKAIRKRQTGFVVLLVLLAAALIFTYAYARTESNPVTYTDHQRFRSDITVNSPMASNRSEVNIGSNVDIDFESGSDTDIESGATLDVNAGAILDINTGFPQY
ncbi:secreted protein, partial [sediment metagenome]